MSFVKNQIKLSISTMIEWYDAMLYIAFIPYLMHAFIPYEGSNKALFILFLGFAAGNFVRPIGSLIFGIIGDRISKLFSYNLAISLMCIGTIAMGLIPSYANFGIMAPILLIVVRVIQGLSMGAQFGTLLAINNEYHKQGNKIGFINALCQSISFLGHNLALIAAFIVAKLSTDSSTISLWRYPFILVILFLAYHLLWGRKISLSTVNNQAKHHNFWSEIPLLLKEYKARLLCNTLLSFCIGGIFAVLVFYSLPFMKFSLGINYAYASLYSLIFFWIIIILSPVFGKVFDHASKQLIYFFIIATIVLSIVFIPYLNANKLHFVAYFIVISILLSAIRGAALP